MIDEAVFIEKAFRNHFDKRDRLVIYGLGKNTKVIVENCKYFEIYNRENWRFVINPDGMQNILGKTYVVALSFEVQLTNMEEPVILTSDLYSGKVEYVIDEKDK